jgi:site-specific recombinase XerD
MQRIKVDEANGLSINNPIEKYAEMFLSNMQSQYYSPARQKDYRVALTILGQSMSEAGIAAEDLHEEMATDLVIRTCRSPRVIKQARFIVQNFVRFLRQLSATTVDSPDSARHSERELFRREYEQYLCRQRGLTERSIYVCWRCADRFLAFKFHGAGYDFSQISPADISSFLQQSPSRGKPLPNKTIPSQLRNFFQFLFQSGRTAINLAPSVPSVAQRYGARLPRHLTSEQVEKLLAAIPRDSAIGRRNYAMVLVLARLGLRAMEVVAMQIDDVDWRDGEVLIRGKGERHDRLPLPHDVGKAIAEYVQRDRIASTRALFVSHRPPRAGFTDAQILNSTVKDALAKTGLKLPTKYVGSHVLRHSLATALVRRGASLSEISDMLRHRSRASTMLYARVDTEGLRSIALPWPETGGAR